MMTSMMPLRLDLFLFRNVKNPAKKKFFREALKEEDAETEEGKSFIRNLHQKDIFTLFEQLFSAYIIDPNKADDAGENIKHFYLHQKWVDQEKALYTNVSMMEKSQ